jgi:hypothetical protein
MFPVALENRRWKILKLVLVLKIYHKQNHNFDIFGNIILLEKNKTQEMKNIIRKLF